LKDKQSIIAIQTLKYSLAVKSNKTVDTCYAQCKKLLQKVSYSMIQYSRSKAVVGSWWGLRERVMIKK
jgi:hypothetical protein